MIKVKRFDKKMLFLDAILVLLIILFAISFLSGPKHTGNQRNSSGLTGEYLGQKRPGSSPELFAPGMISTGMNERDLAIYPDGKEIYFTVWMANRGTIVCVKQTKGRWGSPEVVGFSGIFSDLEPAISPDGKKLFFVSKRPVSGNGAPKDDYDIWFVERIGNQWGVPQNPGAPLNSSENEFYPSISLNQTVYFCADLPESIGGEDIFRSTLINGKYSKPENLGYAINTEGGEFNAFIDPKENYIIYTTTGREDGLGGGDLWINFRLSDSTWSKAINLGEQINSPALDYCPFVTADGKYMFFTSQRSVIAHFSITPLVYDSLSEVFKSSGNGNGDIYWVNTRFLDSFKSQENGTKY